MKEFLMSKKGKMVAGVVILLILLAIVLGIIFGGSSDIGENGSNDITKEQDDSDNTIGGLEIGDSMSESEDTLSASGQEDEMNASSTDNTISEDETPSENKTPSEDGIPSEDETPSENGTPSKDETSSGEQKEETFGEFY